MLDHGGPVPLRIKCRGRRPDGRSCLHLLATAEGGLVVFRHAGWVIVDPRSIRCPKCGTVRAFADGVPEELGGSSGYLVRGELAGARDAA